MRSQAHSGTKTQEIQMFSEISGLFSNPIFSMLGIGTGSAGSTGSPLYGGDGWGPDKLMGGGMGGGGGIDLGSLLLLAVLAPLFGMGDDSGSGVGSPGDSGAGSPSWDSSAPSGDENYVRSNGDLLDGAGTDMSSVPMTPIGF
jgi:hypothetical protein